MKKIIFLIFISSMVFSQKKDIVEESFEVKFIGPVVSIAIPWFPASISIPPADAFILNSTQKLVEEFYVEFNIKQLSLLIHPMLIST